jgi:hypothetical protein
VKSLRHYFFQYHFVYFQVEKIGILYEMKFSHNENKKEQLMCRNIRTLFNFDPPATEEEIHAASLQYVRKITGYNKPSKVNEEAFNRAVNEIAMVSRNLLNTLETSAEPRNREVEAERARARSAKRFGTN